MFGSIVIFLSVIIQILGWNMTKISEMSPPKTNNRTAILISGQLRSGNITWFSGLLRKDASLNMFGHEDPEYPIATMLEWLIKPLALYGGVDLFIYIQIDPIKSNSSWDGDVNTYEPSLNDHRICQLYNKHAIFQSYYNNKVYCITEYEKELMNPFIEKYEFWSYYYYYDNPLAWEMLLQQLYGLYQANLASKQIEIIHNFKYTYKLRLRPDNAIVKEFPSPDSLVYRNVRSCPSVIYYPSLLWYRPGGAEDSFNFGLAEDMDHLLDRYIDITSQPWVHSSCKYKKWSWCAESYLMALLYEKYHICLLEHSEFWVVNIRKADYKLAYHALNMSSNYWKVLNTSKFHIEEKVGYS